MKKIILVGILALSSVAALAQSGTDNQGNVTVSGVSPKYDLANGVRPMSADEFGRFAGSYDLANGKSLSLFSRGLKKYAVVEGGARHEIVATRANTFVSKDQQLKMTIDLADNGDASGELLIAGPTQVAQATKPQVAQAGKHQVAQAGKHQKHQQPQQQPQQQQMVALAIR